MVETKIEILVESAKGSSKGRATLHAVPRDVAFRKGAMLWGGAWLAAVLVLPIPIVHFIAPPILLIAGPALGVGVYKLYNGAVDIVDSEASCPDCGKVVSLGKRAERWPADVVCSGCEARPRIVHGGHGR